MNQVDKEVKNNRFMGIGLAILGGIVYYLSGQIAQTSIESAAYGPAFYPRVLSICLILLGIILAVFPKQGDIEEKEEELCALEDPKAFWIATGLLIGYVVLAPKLGFFVTTSLYLLFSFWKLGDKVMGRFSVLQYLMFAVGMALGVTYLFERLFNVFLPHGILF